MAYVSISRGQFDAQILTDGLEKLPKALGYDVSHQSAYTHKQAIPKMLEKSITAHSVPEIDMGLGLSM